MTARVRIAIALSLWFSACSTMSVNKERVAKIQKVAIIGFSVHQEIPPSLEFKIARVGSSRRHGDLSTMAYHSSLGQESRHASDIYVGLQRKLKEALKWSSLERDFVAKNKKYATLFEGTMKGFQSRPPLGENRSAYAAAGIVDAYPMTRLNAAQRGELITSLGVDAVAIATVTVELEKGGGLKKLVGAGDFIPHARLDFVVYDKDGGEPVWKDIWAKGAPTSEGVGHVMGITNIEALNQKILSAADNCFDKLIANLKEAKS